MSYSKELAGRVGRVFGTRKNALINAQSFVSSSIYVCESIKEITAEDYKFCSSDGE